MIRTSTNADHGSPATSNAAEALHILWIGDATLAKRYVARRAPHVHITSSDSPGALDVLATQKAPADKTLDLVVIDTAAPGCNPLQVLSVAGAEGVNLPAVLLAQPGDEDWTAKAGRLAVCDTLVQTQDFLHQLLATIAQVRLRHDVSTRLEKSRRNEQHLKAILESQPAAVCTVDREGTISAMNQAGLNVLGARAEDVLGGKLTAFLQAEDGERMLAALERARAGEPEGFRHLLRRCDGSLREVRTDVVPFPSADGGSALLTIRDWSDEMEDRELAELTQRMNAAHDETEAVRRQIEQQRDEAAKRAQAAEAQLAKDVAEHERQTTALEILLDEARTGLATARSECGRLQEALTAAQAERQAAESPCGQPASDRKSEDSGVAGETRQDGEAAHERLALQLQAAEARCLALTATVAQMAEQAQTARVAEADATAIFASRCRQLSDELTTARTTIGDGEERCRQLSDELAAVRQSLAGHEERCREMADELAVVKEAMTDNDERCRRAMDAESRYRTQAEALANRLAEDHREFAGIRQDLLRVLVDAEERCEALAARGAATLESVESRESREVPVASPGANDEDSNP